MKAPPLLVLLLALAAVSGNAAEKSWARLAGCMWMEHPGNDGDSFHAKYNGREFIFRLYFVDACETSRQVPERVKDQAKQLGITQARVIEAGHAASELTRSQLAGRPFTVITRWEDARGASRLPRHYAFVLYGKDDAHDLASTLTQNGMVRIYGMPADPPGPTTAEAFRSGLVKLSESAKQKRLGIYGNLTAGGAAQSAIGSGDVAGALRTAQTSAPLTFLFPPQLRAPDVVDSPADEQLSDYAVEAAETGMVIQTGIAEDDFSEIPGWKPPPKKKTAAVPAEGQDEVPD